MVRVAGYGWQPGRVLDRWGLGHRERGARWQTILGLSVGVSGTSAVGHPFHHIKPLPYTL